jgi:hypothetical protein
MKRSYRSTALAAAVGLFFSATLHAQVVQHAETCNGCTAPQIQALLPNCDQGYRYVADFASDHLYLGCYRQKDIRPTAMPYLGAPGGQREYSYAQPSARNQNTFQAYQNLYAMGYQNSANARVSAYSDLTPSVRLGDDGYMNAYDTVRSTQNMDAVKTWLMSTTYTPSNTEGLNHQGVAEAGLSAYMAQLLNNVKTSVLSVDYQVNVTIVFHDRSAITMTFDNSNGIWKYVPGTARDAHGNLIPDSYEAVGGSAGGGEVYNFTNPNPGYDVTNFQQMLLLFNIHPSGGTTTVYECVTVEKQATCHFVTIQK